MPKQARSPGEGLVKITLPLIRTTDILPRKRLFRQLDQALQKPITFVTASGGSGKTTIMADYIRERKLPCLWYQLDEGEADLATFFHYMRLAASNINPRKGEALPLLSLIRNSVKNSPYPLLNLRHV